MSVTLEHVGNNGGAAVLIIIEGCVGLDPLEELELPMEEMADVDGVEAPDTILVSEGALLESTSRVEDGGKLSVSTTAVTESEDL